MKKNYIIIFILLAAPLFAGVTGRVSPSSGDEFVLGKMAIRVTQSTENPDDYVHFSWTIVVMNKTENPVRGKPWIKLLDKDRFLLAEASGDSATLQPSVNQTLSCGGEVKKKLWDQMVFYECAVN